MLQQRQWKNTQFYKSKVPLYMGTAVNVHICLVEGSYMLFQAKEILIFPMTIFSHQCSQFCFLNKFSIFQLPHP